METALARRVGKREQVTEALVQGIIKARECGYTKPHDVVLSIRVCLDRAGFHITRKRK